jgi:hypothetical protein
MEEYRRRREALEQRLAALDQQNRFLQAQISRQMEIFGMCESLATFCQRVQTGLEEATFDEMRQLVELLVDRVVVTMDEVEIRYVIPTSPRSEHMRFCHLHTDYFDPDLICLHMDQIQGGLLDESLMEFLTVMPGTITPVGNSPFIKAVSMDNSLNWATICEQGDYHHNKLCGLAQPFHHGSSSSAKGVPTPRAPIPSAFRIMNTNVACPALASCGTRQIGAKLSGRLHWLFCGVLHIHKMSWSLMFFQWPSFSPVSDIVGELSEQDRRSM